ncbi:FAD-dependent oxidoreductase [Frigidibacter sp. MR17.24]|uniref:FAD-dependent oxidoreductase n=1 Tax=Frigidibacter sp. MR17.24 TaxID=3127345 RepID=UPI003012BD77
MRSADGESFDVVVLGAGAGGLAAAVTAAAGGARVALLERAEVVGGTTAWSGGWIWAPRNPVAQRAGIHEDPQAPRDYLRGVLGNRYLPERAEAFLDAAPEMVAFFEANTALTFDGGLKIPDTYGHQPGAGTGGRSVIAQPYDARGLGADLRLLRLPVRETTFWGMTIQAGEDLKAFMTMTRSARSFAHATRRVLRHLRDLALHGRGMELRNGNALVARLLRSALDAGVTIRTGVEAAALERAGDRVTGVRLADGTVIAAARGVVLACGGYPRDAARRAGSFPRDAENRTLAVETARGDGLRLAEGAGAAIDTDLAQPAAFCPVSIVRWADGRVAPFPHIIDRGKPGVIGVLASGARFCNEGLGYHDYVEAMLRAIPEGQPAVSWLVCDHRFLRRFGLGVVRPAPVPWQGWRRRGYLVTARTIPALARACGIDPAGLEATVRRWNADAATGDDTAFHRGTSPYMRLQGDPEQAPNPTMAPLLKPPFHAVQVVPGSFGTFAGISVDGQARALDAAGRPVPGLFAVGSDSASPFRGFYPAGGINLGPAMTFGFVAGRALSQGPTP